LGRVSFALFFAFAAGTQSRSGAAERMAPPEFDPDTINAANQPEIQVGDKGSAVLRAQILLDRQHFSCGQLDGEFGTNLQKTVSAYQAERKLPVTGSVDAATQASLNSDQAPALIAYTITADDEKGSWVRVPKDMLTQAKLPYLGYSSSVDELAEHFHTNPAVLKALNPEADFSQAGQVLTAPNVLTMPPGQAQSVVVSRSESSVRVYDSHGRLIAFYMATTGSHHDPLPTGDWKIVGVCRKSRLFITTRNCFGTPRTREQKR